MMFPSAEPFTYPNQPLTTFENNQFAKMPPYYNMAGRDDPSSMMQSQMSGQVDADNMEAQLYALPPYMMSGDQWAVNMQNQQQRTQMPNTMSSSGQGGLGMPLTPSGMSWSQQQQAMPQGQAFPDINLNDLFGGGEWNTSLMDQGSGQ